MVCNRMINISLVCFTMNVVVILFIVFLEIRFLLLDLYEIANEVCTTLLKNCV